ncbi:Fe-S cluster assembly iron-binding protein IscA [Acetoanaerobium pronyense]|uniref:Fe-S cluster assembly iron-binding protein IscA n=1 Tax=Acetoanaerobium pronyense TaxID=1482736 RepID=A0ABS4KNN6_9FIRM|nr:Fe-S cluster assembly iron-binding protein IscA [Acetoanaerobium pronyense]
MLFIIDKEEEKEVSYIEIDYENDWAGEDFIITAGF